MQDEQKISKQGLEDLKNELEDRKTNVREKIADEIETARQQGDLSENSAYKSAMESKEFNENRIAQIEEMLKDLVVVENKDKTKVGIGSHVELESEETGEKIAYDIVGENESAPRENKISLSSPIGSALKDKKKGDKVTVTLPVGETNYIIKKLK